jgi:hypothetical protein
VWDPFGDPGVVGYDIKMDLKELYLRMRTGFVLRKIGVASTTVNLLETCPAVGCASGALCMALRCHYLVEERGDNVGVVCFKNYSPQRILWLWIQYVATTKSSVCLLVRYVVAYILCTAENARSAKWNDSKRLLRRGNVNVVGRLLCLAKMRFIVTSLDCNGCTAEGKRYIVNVLGPFYTENDCCGLFYSPVPNAGEKQHI